MMHQTYDNLLAFHVVTTIPGGTAYPTSPNGNISFSNEPSRPEIINLYWAAYDVRSKIITTEWEYFIKPPGFKGLSPETIAKTKITNEDLETKGVSLAEAIQHFNQIIYQTFISTNLSFCIVTESDKALIQDLPNSARDTGVKLPNHFSTYFNLKEELSKAYQIKGIYESLADYLALFKIIPTEADRSCQGIVKDILILINQLVCGGYMFIAPKILNAQHQLLPENFPVYGGGQPGGFPYQNPNVRPYMGGENPDYPQQTGRYQEREEREQRPRSGWYIKMRGIPYSAREREVEDFLRGTGARVEDIYLGYGYDGRFSGEAYVKYYNEEDFRRGLGLDRTNMGSRYIEIFESNETDFSRAKSSHNPQRSSRSYDRPSEGRRNNNDYGHLINDEVGVLRLRGLPYSCTDSEIKDFLREYKTVKDGIQRGTKGGRPSGECYVVFETKDEAHRAMGKNMEKMGTRFIEIFSSNVRELEAYLNNSGGSNSYGSSYERYNNGPNVPENKRKSTLSMMGLPFNTTKKDVVKFFDDFDVSENCVFLVSNKTGRFSGNAIVTFADELEAQRALKNKNLSYMGNRYIELYEYSNK